MTEDVQMEKYAVKKRSRSRQDYGHKKSTETQTQHTKEHTNYATQRRTLKSKDTGRRIDWDTRKPPCTQTPLRANTLHARTRHTQESVEVNVFRISGTFSWIPYARKRKLLRLSNTKAIT